MWPPNFAQGAKPLYSYIFEYENDFFLELILLHYLEFTMDVP